MNKILPLLLLLLSSIIGQAQDKITFSYDNAGNQTQRSLCFGCLSKNSTTAPKKIKALTQDDLQKFFPEDLISYYPNPVKEELYLKWEPLVDNLVTSIQVYGLNGQTLKSYSGLEKSNTLNIPFQSYSTGIYTVLLFYSNGEQKSIKIIKQ
ncbi:T9SS type A sorting domain-containing protein [Flavobacterium bomense]|uniref:T9SS type A sorting domain-containing protein n=1 Tax=Flavobacterium bomense TaxID=2497483 RepID=A0A3S0PVM0_9FLAO|nr:T9SS type A sorting domain-containing protein [Flavobacterium bomense]RTZ03568.1 T9SS type A sorting domain-containing protein [Flavobacterium bomense]